MTLFRGRLVQGRNGGGGPPAAAEASRPRPPLMGLTLNALALLAAGLLFMQTAAAEDRVNVVAATLDMADFAQQVGGDQVEVYAITRGQYDLHAYEPRPTEVVKLRKADLVIVGGMELDAFMPALIDASRNPRIRFGAPGFVDPSRGVDALDVPTEKITGAMGDVHPYGNPHFWFTEVNVAIAVSNITEGLVRVAPDRAGGFRERAAAYLERVKTAFAGYREALAPFRGPGWSSTIPRGTTSAARWASRSQGRWNRSRASHRRRET